MLTTTSLVPKFTMSSRIMLDEVVGWFGGLQPYRGQKTTGLPDICAMCSRPPTGALACANGGSSRR